MRTRIAAILFILLNATGAMAMERALDKEVLLDATVDQVREAWTTRAGIIGFLSADAEIDPRVGGAFHIHFVPNAAPGIKGADKEWDAAYRYFDRAWDRVLGSSKKRFAPGGK